MSFRSIEITRPAEIHIKNGQMHIAQDDGEAAIPLEDIAVITCMGASIRISTMGLIQLAQRGIVFQCIDEKYMPQALLTPCESNSRQALVVNRQIELTEARRDELWRRIVVSKIENQARVLGILGLDGAEKIGAYSLKVKPGDRDNKEATAAKEYFEYFHPGLNRRTDDSINSSEHLSKAQRYTLANVLHNACMIGGKKTAILAGIEIMVDSIRNYITDEKEDEILLPTVLPIEEFGLVTE